MHPLLERGGRSALVAWLLLSSLGCATVLGSWDYGLPKDNLPTEDRLWHIVFPLSVAAVDQCVFKREDTYGFFLEDAAQTPQSYVRVRYVHDDSEKEIHLWAVPSCRMNVKLANSPIINALSDGSNIVVTSGLLQFVRSPDQLAWGIGS